MGKSLIDTTKYPKFVPRLLCILCAIQPVLDALSYWQAELGISGVSVLRTVLLVCIVLLGFTLSKKKKLYIFMFAGFALFWAAHVFACLQNGYTGWQEDLANYIRVLQLPITTVCIVSCLRAQKESKDALLKGLFCAFAVLISLQVLALVTGTEPYTYSNKSIGLRGWSFWPNAQSAIISLLAPMAICFALKKWQTRFWPVLLVSLIAFAMLWLHGTRLAYLCLLLTAAGLALTVLILRLPKKYLLVFLAVCLVFACLLPLSPMTANQKLVGENAEGKQQIFENFLTLGQQQADEKQAAQKARSERVAQALETAPAEVQTKAEALFRLADTDPKTDRLQLAYSYFLPGLTSRFGIKQVAQAYDYSEQSNVIVNERTWKLTYCKLLMRSSNSRLSMFVGVNVSDMMYDGLGYDCENDLFAMYFLYGAVGVAATVLFFGFFLFLIVKAMIKKPKETFTWEAACLGIALLTLLAHCYFTCGVLRRSNTLFYFGVILALIYFYLRGDGTEPLFGGLKNIDGKKKTLFKNTAMLYVLQGSAMLLSLIAVPYETRILGVETYGLVGVSTAIMVYFQLVVDFGFLLSATEEVSRNREDKPYLCRTLTSVTWCKLLLSAASFGVLLLLSSLIPAWREKQLLLILFFISTVFTSFMPDYLYRGIEDMTAIAIRTVIIRTFFTVAIFFLLKKPEDIYWIPVLNIIGNGLAMLAAYFDLHKRFDIHLCRVSAKDVGSSFKRSSVFFASRFATTFYTALNTVILDLITAGGANTSLYSSADKLITTGKNVLTPVSDSLYPYMTKNKDFKLVKKVLLIIMPVIILFCTGCFIFADKLCALLFGADFAAAGNVLRAMLPVGVVILPSYLLGFPTLTAMGLSKYANYSVIFGTVVHLINLAVLYFTGNINMVTLGVLLSVAETVILLFRVVVILKHKDRLLAPPEQEVSE